MIGPWARQPQLATGLLPSTPGLSALAHAAQSGASAEVEALLERVRRIAYGYSLLHLGGHACGTHLVDDIAQDICIAVLGALPGFRDRGRPFEALVHDISAGKVADAHLALASQPLPSDELPDAADTSPTPEDRVVRLSDVRAATELLDQLPAASREVVLLRVAEGLTAEETGAATGMTAGAVRVIQHRALAKMRALALGRSQTSQE